MKKKMIIASLFTFGLLASAAAQPQHGPFPGKPHCCCCCCNHDRPDRPDQRPPRKGEVPSFITDKLIKKLSLTDEQVTQLKEEEKTFMEKMQQMRPDRDSEEQLSPDKMKEKMDTMMSDHDAAVQKILTEEQYKKYQKYMKENRPKGPGNGAPEGPGGPGGPDGPGGPGDGDGDWME